MTIALGIGSNAAVAGFVRGLVTHNLPVPGIDRVVSIFGRDAQDAFGPLTYDGYRSLEAARDTFEWIGAARESRVTVVVGDRSSVMNVAAATPALAKLLQLPVSEGAVLSHRVAQNSFQSLAAAPDQTMRIDEEESRIAGVAPEWLEALYAGGDIDIWIPLDERALSQSDRQSRTFWALARLRNGQSARKAQAALNVNRSGTEMVAVTPYRGMTPASSVGMSRLAALLPAASGAVFLIACANVATFLLSRASSRSHETSVRIALGASRRQLANQLLADSTVIAGAGAAVGALLAIWTSQIIPTLLFERDAARLAFVPDLAGILVSSALCAVVTVGCGLVPLLEMRHDDPAGVLRRERTDSSRMMRRLRAGLVVAQMGCCCLLVVSTALLFASFRSALQTRVGDRVQQSILATVEWGLLFSRPDLGLDYFHRAEQRARSLPAVSSTAWTSTPPGSRSAWQPVRVESPQLVLKDVAMDVVEFSAKTLDLVTVPPIAGRMFGGGDTARSCRVVVVNEEAAREIFDGDAVGRSIQDGAGQHVEVIGVVKAREKEDGAGERRPTVYYYVDQGGTPAKRTAAHFRVPVRPKEARGVLETSVVSQSYFYAMNLSPIEGRLYSDDPTPGECRVGVINQEAAERYFNGRAVDGAVIDASGRRTRIVGVVQSPLLRSSQRRAEPAIYLPMAQDFQPRMTLVIDAREADARTVLAVKGALDAVEGGRSPSVVTTLLEHLSKTALAADRIGTILVGAAAGTAMALGVLGLYGAMSENTRRRRREIAVRLALGAQSWRVVGQVLSEGIRLAGVGTVVGLLGSMLVARRLSQVTPTAASAPLWVWLAAPLVLIVSVAIASVVPARRAAAVDPLTIMRDA